MFYKPFGPPGYFGNNLERMKNVTKGKQYETVLENLDKYVKYGVTILAYTIIGDGPNSTVKQVQTMEDGELLLPKCMGSIPLASP